MRESIFLSLICLIQNLMIAFLGIVNIIVGKAWLSQDKGKGICYIAYGGILLSIAIIMIILISMAIYKLRNKK